MLPGTKINVESYGEKVQFMNLDSRIMDQGPGMGDQNFNFKVLVRA